MKCKGEGCNEPVTGKSQYCSGACRTRASRASVTLVTPEPPNVTVDGKCYNRPAVACREFGTRPEPLDPTDQPIPMNRGRYKQADGTVYQFDCQGKHFECKFPFKDRYGKPHLAVYETVADVRQAASPAPVHEPAGQGASQA